MRVWDFPYPSGTRAEFTNPLQVACSKTREHFSDSKQFLHKSDVTSSVSGTDGRWAMSPVFGRMDSLSKPLPELNRRWRSRPRSIACVFNRGSDIYVSRQHGVGAHESILRPDRLSGPCAHVHSYSRDRSIVAFGQDRAESEVG